MKEWKETELVGHFKAEQSVREKEGLLSGVLKEDFGNPVSFLCFLCGTLNRIPLGHILCISVEVKLWITSKDLANSHLNHYIKCFLLASSKSSKPLNRERTLKTEPMWGFHLSSLLFLCNKWEISIVWPHWGTARINKIVRQLKDPFMSPQKIQRRDICKKSHLQKWLSRYYLFLLHDGQWMGVFEHAHAVVYPCVCRYSCICYAFQTSHCIACFVHTNLGIITCSGKS